MTPDINAIEERRKRLYKSGADNVYVEDYLADTEFLLNRINDLTTQLAEVKADYDAAVEEIKIMATSIRSRGETDCCFVCRFDNMDECPGWDSDECFEYRGRKGNG